MTTPPNAASANADGLHRLYTRLSPRYEAYVAPAFAPLAADLEAWARHCFRAYLDGTLDDPFALEAESPAEPAAIPVTALDLGCGTGLLARQLAAHFQQVIGVDLVAPMLRAAPAVQRVAYLNADLHLLPLRAGSIRLVVSTFGLNSTTPARSLRSIARILRPNGGMVVFQEWGATDALTLTLGDTLTEFTPEDFQYPDPALQAYFDADRAWYSHLQDSDDYYEMLKKAGFGLVWVREAPFVTVPLTLDQFIQHKMVWPSRALILDSLPEPRRREFMDTLTTRLRSFSDDGVTLRWQPPLFRVCAVRA